MALVLDGNGTMTVGNGDYIAKWEHPTLAQPTKEQLDGHSN